MNYAQAVRKQVGKETKQVAGDLGWSREKVYKLIDGTYPNHPVEQTGDLAAVNENHDVAKYIATRSGGHFIPAYDPQGTDPNKILPILSTKIAKVFEVLGVSLLDGVMDAQEIDEFLEAIDNLVGPAVGFAEQARKELKG